MEKFQFVRLQVNKIGRVSDYVHTPIVERSMSDEMSNPVGVVTNAIEQQDCYELDIALWKNKFSNEYADGEICAITI